MAGTSARTLTASASISLSLVDLHPIAAPRTERRQWQVRAVRSLGSIGKPTRFPGPFETTRARAPPTL